MSEEIRYKVCPKCGAMYDAKYTVCDLHGVQLFSLRPATQQEVEDFEKYA